MSVDGSQNDSTLSAELRPLESGLVFLELQGRGPGGLTRLPFLDNPLTFTVDGDEQAGKWSVELDCDSRLIFRSPSGDTVQRLLGEPIDLGSQRWTVVDTRMVPAHCLACLSPELHYRSWPLGEGRWTVGRPGKRLNTLNLDHKSISRAHARIEISGDTVTLTAESGGALTAVNQVPLAEGKSWLLRPDDLLQLGQLHFRWERAAAGPSSGAILSVRLLGHPQVALAAGPQHPLRFSNDNALDLLWRLVAARGGRLMIDRLLEDYWPERPVLRQRKNLSHILKTLQTELGWLDRDYERWLERTPETLALNLECVADCDLWRLQQAVREGNIETHSLLELHPGALLPGHSQPWARGLRTECFLSWLNLLKQRSIPADGIALLGENITRSLRQGEFEEYVYRELATLAPNWGLGSMVRLWLEEFRHQLEQSTGEAPSAEFLKLGLEEKGERPDSPIGT